MPGGRFLDTGIKSVRAGGKGSWAAPSGAGDGDRWAAWAGHRACCSRYPLSVLLRIQVGINIPIVLMSKLRPKEVK